MAVDHTAAEVSEGTTTYMAASFTIRKAVATEAVVVAITDMTVHGCGEGIR